MSKILCRWHVFPHKNMDESIGQTKRGKGAKLMVVIHSKGIPIGLKLISVMRESKLIEDVLTTNRVPRQGRDHENSFQNDLR